jgi:hypothetical protein
MRGLLFLSLADQQRREQAIQFQTTLAFFDIQVNNVSIELPGKSW